MNLFYQRIFDLFACLPRAKICFFFGSGNAWFLLWPQGSFTCYFFKKPWGGSLTKTTFFNIPDKAAALHEQPKKQTKREIKKQQLHFTVVTQRFVILRPWNWACKRRFSYAWSIIRSSAKDRNNCCCRRKINLLNWQNSKHFCHPMTRNDDTWVP